MDDSELTFEWQKSPSVVIKSAYAMAVYPNAPGDIIIRQKSSKGVFRGSLVVAQLPQSYFLSVPIPIAS